MRFLERRRAINSVAPRRRDAPHTRLVQGFEIPHVNPLPAVLGSDVGHHVGRLLAAELAVGALEARLLTAFVPPMPGHVALNGETTAAFRARVEFLGVFPHVTVRIVTVVALGLEVLTGLQNEVQVQLRDRRVET